MTNADRSTVKHGTQNIRNASHQWISESFRVHQIHFRPGIRPDPAGGAYSAPPQPITHSHGSVLKATKQVNGKGQTKFDPSPHRNPLIDLHKNWHVWLRPGRHSTCKILYRSVQGFLFSRYVILPCFWGDYIGFSSFFKFFNKAYTPKRIVTQSTSEHVVPGTEVPVGGLDNYIW